MKIYRFFMIFPLICMLISCAEFNKNDSDEIKPPEELPIELIDNLNRVLISFSGSETNLPESELFCLDDLGKAKIIAMGEATHGTHEFFEMKHRIFRYLVEKHGFRAFAFECDVAESIFFDQYVNGASTEPLLQLMLKKMIFWTWKTPEVKSLLEWMRQYNIGKPLNKRIRFIGFDCQYTKYQPDMLRDYLRLVSPDFLVEAEPIIVMAESYRDGKYSNFSAEEETELNNGLNDIFQKMGKLQAEMVKKSSLWDFKMARQLVNTMLQVHQVRKDTGNSLRDVFMADNIQWIKSMFNTAEGIAVWAHNSHVACSRTEYPEGSLGFNLRSRIGSDYKSIGFCFNSGQFTAITISYYGEKNLSFHGVDCEPLKGSINDLFSKAVHPVFLIRLDKLEKNTHLQQWLSQPRKMMEFCEIIRINNPLQNYLEKVLLLDWYDVIIHFENTTKSSQLNSSYGLNY